MEKLVSLLAVVALASVVACGGAEENPESAERKGPTIGASHQSECLSKAAQQLIVQALDQQSSSIEAAAAEGQITVVDHSAEFNCCLKAEMQAAVSVSNNEIVVVEVEEESEVACDCTCKYELSITISDLETGSYSVKVYREAIDPGTLLFAGTAAVP